MYQVPAEAMTNATLLYTWVMKYSVVLIDVCYVWIRHAVAMSRHSTLQGSLTQPSVDINGRATCEQLLMGENLLTVVSIVWSGNHFALSTRVCSFQFPSLTKKFSQTVFQVLTRNSFITFPSVTTFLITHFCNQNRPRIFFIQHHRVCSCLAVVCSGANVSMELHRWFLISIRLFTHS